MADEESVVEDLLAPQRAATSLSLLDELAGRAQFNLRATYHEHVVLAEVVAADPEIAELRERTRDLPEDAAYAERVRLGELVARAMEHKRELRRRGAARRRPAPTSPATSSALRRRASSTCSTWRCSSTTTGGPSSRSTSRGWRRRSTSGSGCAWSARSRRTTSSGGAGWA